MTPSITLMPGEVFVTLDADGRPLFWKVVDNGLVKLMPGHLLDDIRHAWLATP